MARSRRRTPVIGITTAESDKLYKRQEHRRERRAVAQALSTGDDPPGPKTFGDPWNSDKDGKQWFDPERHPKYLRK